jgi:hypothetical protein
MTSEQTARRTRAMADLSDSVQALRSYASERGGGPSLPIDGGEMPGIEVRPANAYEAVTRQMVEALQADLHEIKGRLNTLLVTLLGGMVLDVFARWLSR